MRSLSVVYTGEPDVVHEFVRDGQGYLFGRDDDACDIVIWSAVNDQSLSRVAGRIWLMDDELWLRNLSLAHDLLIQVPGLPPEPYLPPRAHPDEPGPARSLPRELCLVLAPGGCELLVRQEEIPVGRPPAADRDDEISDDDGRDGDVTARLPSLPDHLAPVAHALCAPLLAGSRLPASYAQVATALGVSSHKRIRLLVGELCALYADAVPELTVSARARQRREESLMSVSARYRPRLVGGVWRFQERPAAEGEGAAGEGDAAEAERRRALMLPDYYEVAHLLVRRGLVRPPMSAPDARDVGADRS